MCPVYKQKKISKGVRKREFSNQVVDIVEALEGEFQIELDAECITAENFANKDSILSLMERFIRK